MRPPRTRGFSILLLPGPGPGSLGPGGVMTTGPEPSPPDAGTLRWGLKRRFLQYLAGLADGQCSVTDGASLAPGPLFVFTAADDPPDHPSGGRTVLRYRG